MDGRRLGFASADLSQRLSRASAAADTTAKRASQQVPDRVLEPLSSQLTRAVASQRRPTWRGTCCVSASQSLMFGRPLVVRLRSASNTVVRLRACARARALTHAFRCERRRRTAPTTCATCFGFSVEIVFLDFTYRSFGTLFICAHKLLNASRQGSSPIAVV